MNLFTNRDILYNRELTPQQAVLALMGLPIEEGLNYGDRFELHVSSLEDTDTRLPVPTGVYSVASSDSQLIHVVQYNPDTRTTGGREYTIHAQDFESALLGGNVTLHEGRIPGTVENPAEIHMMFKKGYLRKKARKGGEGSTLQYNPRAFSHFQSGTPNPEHKMNKIRHQHQKKILRRRSAGE